MSTKIKEFLIDNLEISVIEDITRHGCCGGVPHFTYYHETVEFHDSHEEEIWEMLYEDAESEGVSVMKLISSFGGEKDVGSMEQFKNLLCWYAVERVAREIVEESV